MKHEKGKIKYGNVEIDDGILDPKNHKVRITTFIDGDILERLKKEAAQENMGYQTYLNILLRKLIDGHLEHQTTESIKNAIREMFGDGELVVLSSKSPTARGPNIKPSRRKLAK